MVLDHVPDAIAGYKQTCLRSWRTNDIVNKDEEIFLEHPTMAKKDLVNHRSRFAGQQHGDFELKLGHNLGTE